MVPFFAPSISVAMVSGTSAPWSFCSTACDVLEVLRLVGFCEVQQCGHGIGITLGSVAFITFQNEARVLFFAVAVFGKSSSR